MSAPAPLDEVEVILRLPPDLAASLRAMIQPAGGEARLVRQMAAMAAKPPPVRPDAHQRLGRERRHAAFHLAPADRDALDRMAAAAGFNRSEWLRALVCSRLRRQPQLAPEELRANSAVRYELQRICAVLREAAASAHEAGRDRAAADLLAAWRDARGQLLTLRAALVGNYLYWDGRDE